MDETNMTTYHYSLVHFGPVSDGEDDWWELIDLGEPDEESILPGPDVYETPGFDPDDEFGPEEGGDPPGRKK